MNYDFACRVCEVVTTVKSPIGHIPRVPFHCHHQMQRLWDMPRVNITRSRGEYIERAYSGEEVVPGLSTQEVRETVDKGFSKQ